MYREGAFNCPYTLWNYPKQNSAALRISKTSIIIRKFLDSRTTILTSWTAKAADSVEGTPRCHRWAEAPLERNPLNSVESLEITMAAAAHVQEKPKAKERRLINKNIKRVYEELDNGDELLQDALNVRSSVTNGYALSCKCFLPRPRASDSAIVYEYITHACTCVDKRHDVVHSLVFDKLRLNAPSLYALLRRPRSKYWIRLIACVGSHGLEKPVYLHIKQQ